MDNGLAGFGICAKGEMDVLGYGNAFDVKVDEVIEVSGVIADEAVEGREFFYWGLVPVSSELVREAPLLSWMRDHEALAVGVGKCDPELYEVFAVVGFNIRPVPPGGSCGKGLTELCRHFVCFDWAVDIVCAGGGVLVNFAYDVCEVFCDMGMRLVRKAGIYAECYGFSGDFAGDITQVLDVFCGGLGVELQKNLHQRNLMLDFFVFISGGRVFSDEVAIVKSFEVAYLCFFELFFCCVLFEVFSECCDAVIAESAALPECRVSCAEVVVDVQAVGAACHALSYTFFAERAEVGVVRAAEVCSCAFVGVVEKPGDKDGLSFDVDDAGVSEFRVFVDVFCTGGKAPHRAGAFYS